MTNYDFYMVRSFMLNSLNPKNVKVSFYLMDKTQSTDGNLIVGPPEATGFNIEKIGTRFDGGTKVENTGIGKEAVYQSLGPHTSGSYKTEKTSIGGNIFDSVENSNKGAPLLEVSKDYIIKESQELIAAIKGKSGTGVSGVDDTIKLDFNDMYGGKFVGAGNSGLKSTGPGGGTGNTGPPLQKSESLMTREINRKVDDIFGDMDTGNSKKQGPKKSKAEPEEDQELDGDDLLDLMDNL